MSTPEKLLLANAVVFFALSFIWKTENKPNFVLKLLFFLLGIYNLVFYIR